MAHDPTLGYADYFAAGSGAGGATLVPEVNAVEHEMYGVGLHQPGVEMFAARGLMAPAAMASAQGKAAALVHVDGSYGFQFVGGEQQHQQLSQAPVSLSLHGPPDQEAASFMLQHHQLGGDVTRQQQQQHQPSTAGWLQGAGAWQLRGSCRFLLPGQQLLQEFCSIPVESTTQNPAATAPKRPAQEDDGGGSPSSASWPPPTQQIQAMDAAELQRLKAKLYAMLQEVDRRYRRYREQMRAVAGSFEAVAGDRAAEVYTKMAARTISRHFRSLRDGVAAHVRAVRRALGEKQGDGAPPGVTRGETPRLRALDQCLRQHKAYQSGMLESQPWRPQRGLPERAVSVLRAWLFEHFLHPYPSDVDKHILARQTGLSRSQVSNWFINARVRLWKPMVEEMYAEEMKDKEEEGSSGGGGGRSTQENNEQLQKPDYHLGSEGYRHGGDQKPTRAQLLHDAGSLASVVRTGGRMDQQQGLGFGVMDHLDFDAYAAGGFGNGGGGVSLTLGLQQQHADPNHSRGVNVAFAPASSSSSSAAAQGGGGGAADFMFMAGEHQIGGTAGGGGDQFVGPVVMEGADQHYRVLSGATGFHLLRDLAG